MNGEEGDVGFALQQDAAAYGAIPRCLAAEEVLHRRLWGLFDRLRKTQKRRGVVVRKVSGNTLPIHHSAGSSGSASDTPQ